MTQPKYKTPRPPDILRKGGPIGKSKRDIMEMEELEIEMTWGYINQDIKEDDDYANTDSVPSPDDID